MLGAKLLLGILIAVNFRVMELQVIKVLFPGKKERKQETLDEFWMHERKNSEKSSKSPFQSSNLMEPANGSVCVFAFVYRFLDKRRKKIQIFTEMRP